MLGRYSYDILDPTSRAALNKTLSNPDPSLSRHRVRRDGKFFRLGDQRWFVRGFCYGPFAPGEDDAHLPARAQVSSDFRQIAELGANTVRVYHAPPRWFLDEALDHGLRVFVDVPWDKHRCFLDDWAAMEEARHRVRRTARVLGGHPGLFAISVANEIPADVVRFQGRVRVAQFLDQLIGIVKSEAPECLATFVNFPSTEFLAPRECDFICFNVFLHDEESLGDYLDRLQHRSGERPVVIGEYGIDTLREGEERQAELLAIHARSVARRGYAGSLVFSFTDDWHTGGKQVDDWTFGVCRRDRSWKPSADAVRQAWKSKLHDFRAHWPRVSVVVCSYNGAATLRECLQSLMRLEYPDYEVILVDDGSTDDTPQIAAEFPQVRYHRQENRGLSVSRNVGAKLASGDIIAYTDSDCVADESWLRYLIDAMEVQRAEAIGGLNLSPPTDGWVAKCVNASPGNPAHVMLDDQTAEHVPGCNMAFRRHVLLGLGGFDPQFRQAGDDVDMCWRILDADLKIGFAPAAVVWHHRRATVRAYAKQQSGYGRSEALVHFKHPQRCGTFGRSVWRGVIYGDAMLGQFCNADTVYHGRFGGAAFQLIYRNNDYSYWNIALSLEWHAAALFVLMLGAVLPPLALLPVGMWAVSLGVATRAGATASLPCELRFGSRVLVGGLHLLQPVVRGWYRTTHLLKSKRRKRRNNGRPAEPLDAKWVAKSRYDVFWETTDQQGRDELLSSIVHRARAADRPGDYDNAWADWDVKIVGDPWHDIEIRTATEEIGWPRRFTRASVSATQTRFTAIVAVCVICWSLASIVSGQPLALGVGLAASAWFLWNLTASRRSCVNDGGQLVAGAIEAIRAKEGSEDPGGDEAMSERRSTPTRAHEACESEASSTPARV